MGRASKISDVNKPIDRNTYNPLIDDYVSQTETGYTQTIPLVQEASYIIMKSGSYYYALNGSTNKVDYGGTVNAGGVDGTDAAAVIQAAINALTSGGKILIKASPTTYNIGNTTLNGKSNTVLEFESYKSPLINDFGATIEYTGTGTALKYYSEVRGDIRDFTIIRPSIKATNGLAIKLDGAYCFTIIEPNLEAKYGIDLANLNTGKIIGGGYITGTNSAIGSGTYGIRTGSSYATNLIEIDVHQISVFEYGIQLGIPLAEHTANEDSAQINIHGIDLSSNQVGLQLFGRTSNINFHDNWMESMGVACIRVTSNVAYYLLGLKIEHNLLAAASPNHFINIPTANPAYFLRMTENRYMGNGVIYLGNAVYLSELELSSFLGTLTNNSPYLQITDTPATRRSGTATLLNGQTSIKVAHGLVAVPTRILITPTSDPKSKFYWISSYDSDADGTKFTISASADPTANVTFDWTAIV